MRKELGQTLHKFCRIEPDTVFGREEQDAGEMLRGLDIHVFIIAQVGQLGPEGDIQRESEGKGWLRGFVGQDAMAVVCKLPGINADITEFSCHRGEPTSRGPVQGITAMRFP